MRGCLDASQKSFILLLFSFVVFYFYYPEETAGNVFSLDKPFSFL